MTLFVVGSALTVAVFFLALWLLPEQPLSLFISRDFLGFKQTEKSLRFSVCFFF
jgi:hypothetical protein